MPSEKAILAALEFLGEVPESEAAFYAPRRELREVPESDAGLRLYAANGDWSAVVRLAGKLEQEIVRDALSKGEDVHAPASTSEQHEHELRRRQAARLPYVLVQVTAYLQMRRVEEAKRVIDALGDIEGGDYRDAATHESLAPFSLRFLAALMPFYTGVPAEAHKRLYHLLDECETRLREYTTTTSNITGTSGSEDVVAEVMRRTRHQWRERTRRVLRALVYLHFAREKYALAMRLAQRLVDMEHAATDSEEDDASATASRRLARRLRHILQLQQLACLALHYGNLACAEGSFGRMEAVVQSASSALTGTSGMTAQIDTICTAMLAMNEAFVLVFHGKFDAAATKLRGVALMAGQALREQQQQQQQGQQHYEQRGSDGEDEMDLQTLCAAMLQQLERDAQVSHVTCLPYVSGVASEPLRLMTTMTDIMEQYLQQNTKALVADDAFLSNAVRIYTLSGQPRPRLERLASLIEVFHCEATSVPNLEKMI